MDLERALECGNSWNGTNMFMNEAYEDSNTLALYTDASGTEDLGVTVGRNSFKGDGKTH